MGDANPVSTPMDPNISLEPNKEKGETNCSNDYASLIGSLQYLATATCPDIAYAVNRLAAYTTNLSFTHYGAAKCMLRYIKGTRNYGITYHAHSMQHVGPTDSNIFYGFLDAAFANADDRRSISGYVYLSNGGLIRKNTLSLERPRKYPKGCPNVVCFFDPQVIARSNYLGIKETNHNSLVINGS